MKQIFLILTFAVSLGILPEVTFAQLSSTNYQVDVQYVGEEGGGYATSTSYQLGGSEGTPYEYADTPGATTTPATGGGSTGSRVPAEPGTSTPSTGVTPGVGEGGANGAPGSDSGETQGEAEGGEYGTSGSGVRGEDGEVLEEGGIREDGYGGVRPWTSVVDTLVEIFLEHKVLYSVVFSLILLLIILSIVLYLRSREE